MTVGRIIIAHIFASILLSVDVEAQHRTFDQQVADLATQLSGQVTKSGLKRVAVADFTDLQGAPTELGRVIAEEISVALVALRDGFAVMDRANLARILGEHRLTAAGLVNPENAKKLGQFAGVDAIVVGNVVSFTDDALITAKVIATETAEILGASKARVPLSADLKDLSGRTVGVANAPIPSAAPEQPHVEKHGVRVEIASVRSTNAGLTVVARIRNGGRRTLALLIDGNESQVSCDRGFVHFFESAGGIGQFQRSGAVPMKLSPGSEETATLRFIAMNRTDLEPQDRGHASFDLQLELVSLVVYESGEASALQESDRKINVSISGLTLRRNPA